MTRQEALKIAKPILFNTDMVQAILRRLKTQTRRAVKLPHCGYFEHEPPRVRPQYAVGDILYVRETWGRYSRTYGITPNIYYRADEQAPDKIKWIPSIYMPKEAARIFLRVTEVRIEHLKDIITDDYRTPGNINAEGLYKPCEKCTHHNGDCKDFIKEGTCKLVHSFATLWNGTVSKSGVETYGWSANPWVWVIEFERIEVEQ